MKMELAKHAPARATERHVDRLATLEVAVLMGGTSSEREVSLRSGEAVARALASAPEAGAPNGPARVRSIELAPDGRWVLDGRGADPLVVLRELQPSTVFFLALHGGRGEDGTLQGLLDALGRIHTGSGVEASALCMNKHLTRLALRDAGVRVASGRLVTTAAWRADAAALLRELAALSSTGFSVKPNRGGSSVATSLLDGAEGLRAAIETVLATGDDALVEERIRGAETTCGVLGNRGGALRSLTPVEIVPKDGRFFDYQEKYSSAGAQEFCPPRSLAPKTVARIGELALLAHAAAGCDGYSRIDFMIPRDASGVEGEPVALEINTLPGMTARSLLPLAAGAEGLSFRALCVELVALALDKAAAQRS
ncbi:MAG: D-alanine--D-alanine ligase [Planctomycetes bacterium]|nr:D-alanine--D-alanine ligase [Planctomycetota bacterium]